LRGATITRWQRGNGRHQVFLDGDRGSIQQTPALRRHSESLTTAVDCQA
jgi:hypothetical protein